MKVVWFEGIEGVCRWSAASRLMYLVQRGLHEIRSESHDLTLENSQGYLGQKTVLGSNTYWWLLACLNYWTGGARKQRVKSTLRGALHNPNDDDVRIGNIRVGFNLEELEAPQTESHHGHGEPDNGPAVFEGKCY